jgi:purine-binding chemotaxis protein CheW
VPENANWLRGVINLRGTAMPIIDLRIRFKTNMQPSYNSKTIIIATKIQGGKYIGYVVDEINDIETIAPSELLPYNEGRIDAINAKFLKGYINKKDRMTVILDTDKILKDAELAEIGEAERLIA